MAQRRYKREGHRLFLKFAPRKWIARLMVNGCGYMTQARRNQD